MRNLKSFLWRQIENFIYLLRNFRFSFFRWLWIVDDDDDNDDDDDAPVKTLTMMVIESERYRDDNSLSLTDGWFFAWLRRHYNFPWMHSRSKSRKFSRYPRLVKSRRVRHIYSLLSWCFRFVFFCSFLFCVSGFAVVVWFSVVSGFACGRWWNWIGGGRAACSVFLSFLSSIRLRNRGR